MSTLLTPERDASALGNQTPYKQKGGGVIRRVRT